jgi:hypothetical protein
MPRNKTYAIAVVLTVAVVAGPALAQGAHSHAAKHAASARVGARGPRGPRGARGPRGLKGAAGQAGPAGAPGAPGANGSSAGAFLRTIVVSPGGADPAANGELLLSALAGVASASAATPYLVWIEPGVYDIGSTPLRIPSHVDVQGSGQDVTTVAGEGPVTLIAAAGSELRELTVSDTNGGSSAEAIDTSGGLNDVAATAAGGSAATAVLANGPTLPLVNVTATATTGEPGSSARGIDTQNAIRIEGGTYSAIDDAASSQSAALFAESSTFATGATFEATGGAAAYPVDVVGSSITATIETGTLEGAGGFFVAPGDKLDVGGSQIPGVVASISGTANCPDDWLADYSTASTDCS